MQDLRSTALVVVLAAAISAPAMASPPAKGTWSIRDLDMVADAAMRAEFDLERHLA